MRLFLILLLMFSIPALGQSVSVWELVQVKPGFKAEALYFYEHNWKLYREIALKKGFIQSYRLEQTAADSAGTSELLLITEYKDSIAYRESESNFRGILATARPDGPVLMNQHRPDEFRKTVLVKIATTIFRSPARNDAFLNPGHQE
jgi:hypothetical protein